MNDVSRTLRPTLEAVAARLRGVRLLRAGGIALACIFATATVMVTISAILAGTGLESGVRLAGIALMVFFAVYFLHGAWQPVPLRAAAEEADRVAGLRDELKSSLWFAGAREPSPWVAAHLRHAEGVARGIDPRRIVPMSMPASGWAAVGMLVVLGVVSVLSPRFMPSPGGHDAAAESARARPAGLPEVAKLQDEAAQVGDAEAQARLERALAAIDDPRRSAGERRRALDDARQYLGRRALEAGAATEQMSALADALAGREGMEDVAKALREGDAKAAADALRQRLGADSAVGQAAAADAPAPKSGGTDKELVDALKDAMQGAAQDGQAQPGGETAGRLAKAVQNLEEIARRLDGAAALNRISRRMDALSTSMNRDGGLRAAQFGQQQGSAQGSESSETGEANIQGGHLFRLGAVARERRQPGQDASRAGDASGDAKGDPVVGDEIAKIDAKFHRETVQDQESEEGGGRDSAFYAATREADARVDYAAVQHRYRQVGEEALSAERIALRHRDQVKAFFSESSGRAQ